MQMLNEHAEALTRREITERAVTDNWTELFAAFLSAHTDARADIEELATAAPNRTTTIGSQNNYSSGVFIGNNHYGEINISTRGDR
ncbi:hypothetical protein [Kitasatospora sp. NPDC087314]|uniref:hypothetical protein n=1 Tax=Kitasatospora sp. NPDC087314 TaxID=3364068 RepID=UPI003824947F